MPYIEDYYFKSQKLPLPPIMYEIGVAKNSQTDFHLKAAHFATNIGGARNDVAIFA